jgi:hypothetical protein
MDILPGNRLALRDQTYLIACCGMCTFAAMEPIINPSANTFAVGIMKIIMRYGFCHTFVLNKDSKFFGVCCESLNLLKINCYVLSGGNHDPMLVERINCYLNKGLKIMVNKQDSPCIALEAILLLIYTWNSCPVPGTAVLLLLATNSNSQSTSPLESTPNSCLRQAPSSLTPASLLLTSMPAIKLH